MRQIRVIIVDDESRIRRGLEKLVLNMGEDWNVVKTFSDGQELIDAFDQYHIDFDVLLTDVRMPVMNGLQLIKELKERTSFSPIVISGHDDFTYLQTALREGALDYLIKPVDRGEFKKQLTIVKERIIKQWIEQETLNTKANQLRYMKQVEKLKELTRDDEIDVSIFEWTEEFPSGSYILMQIIMDQAFNQERHLTKEEIRLKYEQTLDQLSDKFNGGIWRWRGEGASYWILINSDNHLSFKEEAYDFACLIQEKSLNFISISEPFTDLALLPTIKKDLLILSNFRFIRGDNKIFQQGEKEILLEKSDFKSSKEIQQMINNIIQALERLNEQELIFQLNRFMDELKKIRSPIEIQQYLHILSVQLIGYLIRFTPRISSEILDFQDVMKLLKKVGNFTELQKEIQSWLSTILKTLEKLDEEKHIDQIEIAKQWILENLNNNITIEKIASEVYMNPTYFCEYFKNQTGETVLNYVTNARINRARELLLTTNLKMYEISEQVGYSDTKYFSKLFKKYYGDPPSIYKEKLKTTS